MIILIQLKKLNEQDKSSISRTGIRIGAKFFFMPNLLKKLPMELNAILMEVFNNHKIKIVFILFLRWKGIFYS